MSTNDKKETVSVEQPEGIDVSNVTFDPNGKVDGLAEDVLDSVSGGLAPVDDSNNGQCPQANVGSCH